MRGSTGSIRDMGDGWLQFRFGYDPDLIADLKAELPHRARHWDPKLRCWVIQAEYRIQAWYIGQRHGVRFIEHRHQRQQPPPPPPRMAQAQWAKALFDAVPPHLHEPVFKALTRVLHPDVGGDAETMKALNAARPSTLAR